MSLTTAQALALRRARRGQGQTGDNPSVGCLILSPRGQVLGLAHTAPGGRPHAEVQALMQAGEAAKGANVFVTLEPCRHQGQSGPCSEALIAAQVGRVVIGVLDANPEVSGQGAARLRAAGIEVEVLNDPDCARHHLGFNRRMMGGRPYTVLKIATSADGAMTKVGAQSQIKITGPEVQRQVHALRAASDLILTGRGTMEIDKPRLNVRIPGYTGAQPKVLVWQRSMDLASLTANQVLIEAGPTLASALFDQVDELRWFRGPQVFGAEGHRPDFLTADPLDFAAQWPKFTLVSRRAYGADVGEVWSCLLYTSPSPRDGATSRMPSSA